MKILIIDDDRTVCSSLSLLLSKRGGYDVRAIHYPTITLETIGEYQPELILLDMNFTIDTSGKQGIRLLELIRAEHPNISVVLMTGWATVQLAVKGMKIGAKDFVAKPWDNKALLDSVKNIEVLYHRGGHGSVRDKSTENTTDIVGQHPSMVDIFKMVDKVATTEASVLITGESGTGKELIAEAIHRKSKRANEPFIKVNLGGISTELFESEMFGHLKGSFTGAYTDRDGRFAVADKGTIFLDEIGELALASQVKMLRVLQEKTYEQLGSSKANKADVRVISATNKDLRTLSIDGHFREDLYYRVNLINIHLPPLRERSSDIPLLVKHFIRNVAELYDVGIPYVADETMHWLSIQEYKGNIRQLKNIVERTFLLNLDKKQLTTKDFQPAFAYSGPATSMKNELNLQELEIDAIKKALNKHGHSVSSAARSLGITRSSLYRRLEKYNIPHEPSI